MKTEDIDRKIGMPDIDMEWAKFEKEVIEASEEKSKVDSVKYKVNSVKWRVDSRIWSRAAMITGIIMSVSLITLASIYLYSTPQEKTEPQETGSEMAVTVPVQEINAGPSPRKSVITTASRLSLRMRMPSTFASTFR